MINIAFTRPFYKPKPGGVGIYIRLLLRNLNRHQFWVYFDQRRESFEEIPKNRSKLENLLIQFNLLLYLIKYPYLLIKYRIDVVHSNPSMIFIPIFRDSLFVLVSYLLKKRILVFIHGWNEKFAGFIKNYSFFRAIFTWVFNKADVIIVLANEFKIFLEQIGIKSKIIVETTMVDDNLYEKISKNQINQRNWNNNNINLLFLSRIEHSKGIFRTIEAFSILCRRHQNLILNVAGDGSDLPKAKDFAMHKGIKNINFLGYIENEVKKEVLSASHIFIFPTEHGEGLPISVLEAISFGLPVVTRPVGGIKDFFIDGKHGFITESKSSHEFAELVEKLISNNHLRNKISEYNYVFGQNKFMASVSTKRIEKIYCSLASTEK